MIASEPKEESGVARLVEAEELNEVGELTGAGELTGVGERLYHREETVGGVDLR
jgi:hypothetical protein